MRKALPIVFGLTAIPMLLILEGCGKVHAQADADAATSPPEAKVVPFADASFRAITMSLPMSGAPVIERRVYSSMNSE